jgi:hypothetical protein
MDVHDPQDLVNKPILQPANPYVIRSRSGKSVLDVVLQMPGCSCGKLAMSCLVLFTC